MPPRRWSMDRKTPMTAAIRQYLATGDYGSSREPDRGPFDYAAFDLAGSVLRGNYAEIQTLWARHGAGLLEDWVTVHSGSRPHGWWVVEAREPRHVLRGVELLGRGMAREDRWWRPRFGVPFLAQARPSGFTGYPTIESEAAFLDRLGLLADAERARVPAEDWEPVQVDPFLIDERAVLAPTRPA